MTQEYFTGVVQESSKYLARFQNLASAAPGALTLLGDMLYVEKLGKIEAKTASGLYLPTDSPHSYKQQYQDDVVEMGIVLMTGPGDIDENGQHCAMNCKVGDIIELPANVRWYTQFMHMTDYKIGTIGKLRDAQITVLAPRYLEAMEALNATQSKV